MTARRVGGRTPARSDATSPESRDVRTEILTATEELLTGRRFAEITVADILGAADVARGSFYFYFESKYAVLAELARRATDEGRAAGATWLERASGDDAIGALRQSVLDGARVWERHAAVLRAVVENWRDDAQIAALWVDLLESYADAAVQRIEQDREAGLVHRSTVDVKHLASALSWTGERLYYLAAIGVAPFDNRDVLVGVLTQLWASAFYTADGHRD
jgi:TetR/AcrR family transcriptional regulator, ethionamide resistance regulator